MTTHRLIAPSRPLLNKVPQITLYFWVIKVLCTTVGETAADFLNVNLDFGLTGTSIVTGLLLAVALAAQFTANRYRAGRYWTAVTLVSVFGTLVTDNLTDALGVPLEVSTVVFGVLLAVAFGAWYSAERTLSIHSIFTRRREAFYWTAILLTFALGTATGDLMSQVLGLGFLVAGLVVVALIAAVAVAWRFGLHAVLSFWIIYVLTRPLGAALGDYLSQPTGEGGLGLGATLTSVVFFAGIIVAVLYLAATKADVIAGGTDAVVFEEEGRGGVWQTVIVVGLLLGLGVAGYLWRTSALQTDVPVVATAPGDAQGAPQASVGQQAGGRQAQPSRLGDLSPFRTISQDTLQLVNGGDQAGATTRVRDLEIAWDDAEARLKPRDKTAWTALDSKIDKVLRAIRATSPDPAAEKAALTALLDALG
ncbi:MAG TPA: hypothetical protein VGE11_21330 [Pseudonocardia sp.]